MKVGDMMSGKDEEGDMGGGEREERADWGTGKPRTFPLSSHLWLPSQFPIIRLYVYILPSHPNKQFNHTSFKYCFGVSKAGYCDIYLDRPKTRR